MAIGTLIGEVMKDVRGAWVELVGRVKGKLVGEKPHFTAPPAPCYST
jgi:hypothetical protein